MQIWIMDIPKLLSLGLSVSPSDCMYVMSVINKGKNVPTFSGMGLRRAKAENTSRGGAIVTSGARSYLNRSGRKEEGLRSRVMAAKRPAWIGGRPRNGSLYVNEITRLS